MKPYVDPAKSLGIMARDWLAHSESPVLRKLGKASTGPGSWEEYRIAGAHGGTLAGETARTSRRLLLSVLKGQTVPSYATDFAAAGSGGCRHRSGP